MADAHECSARLAEALAAAVEREKPLDQRAAEVVMAHLVMAYIVMAYVFMAARSRWISVLPRHACTQRARVRQRMHACTHA